MSLIKTIRIWECRVCGKQEEWNENWRCKTILNKRGMWDKAIMVCSETCAEEFDKKSKKKEYRKK